VPKRPVPQPHQFIDKTVANTCDQLSLASEHANRCTRTQRRIVHQKEDTLRKHQLVVLVGAELEDNRQKNEAVAITVSMNSEMRKNEQNINENRSNDENDKDDNNNKECCNNENISDENEDEDNENINEGDQQDNDDSKERCNNVNINEDDQQDNDDNKEYCNKENINDDEDEDNVNINEDDMQNNDVNKKCFNNDNNNTSSESISANDSDVKNSGKPADNNGIDRDLFTEYDITNIDSYRRVEEWRQQYTIEYNIQSFRYIYDLSMDDSLWKIDAGDIQLSTFCASLLQGVAADDDVIDDTASYVSTYIWKVSRETPSNDDGSQTGFDHNVDTILISSYSASDLDDKSNQGHESEQELGVERRRVSEVDAEPYSNRAKIFLCSLQSESSDMEDTSSSSSSSTSPTPNSNSSTGIVCSFTTDSPRENVTIVRCSFAESEDSEDSEVEEAQTASRVDGQTIPFNTLRPLVNQVRTKYDGGYPHRAEVPSYRGVEYFIDDDDGLEEFMAAADRQLPLSDIEEVSATSDLSRTSSVVYSVPPTVFMDTSNESTTSDEFIADVVFEEIDAESTICSSDSSVVDDLVDGCDKKAPPASPTSSFVEYQYSEMVTIGDGLPSFNEARTWQWVGLPRIDDLCMRMFGETELILASGDVQHSSKSTMIESAASVVISNSYVIDPIIDRLINVIDQ